MWKESIEAKLNSLSKCQVFESVVQTAKGVKPVRKRNEDNEITRDEGRLVAQGFSQRPGIDHEETYSLMVDEITLRFFIGLVVYKNLDMHLMDVVITYLYGSLDNDI